MKLILIAAALLAGCGTARPAPEVVKVPVTVPCLGDAGARPVSQFGQGPYPGDKEAARLALADANAWEGYSVKLEAAQAGCLRKSIPGG